MLENNNFDEVVMKRHTARELILKSQSVKGNCCKLLLTQPKRRVP